VFGHDMDVAKLRGAPLGWYFPLFFIIQALMPFGFSFMIAASQDEIAAQIVIVALGGVLSALALVFMLRVVLRAKARVQHFEEARGGRRAQAQVLGVEYVGQAGTVKSGGSRRRYVKLRVHVRAWFEDQIPFELAGEACYTATEQGLLEMRPAVSISLHPSGTGPFLVHPDSIAPVVPMMAMQNIGVGHGAGVRIQRTDEANRRW
jgi:hypothetical protein